MLCQAQQRAWRVLRQPTLPASRAAAAAFSPKSVAVNLVSLPPKVPKAVRLACATAGAKSRLVHCSTCGIYGATRTATMYTPRAAAMVTLGESVHGERRKHSWSDFTND